MGREPENDRQGQLAWIAARVRGPAERIAGSAAWRSCPGPGDSLDLIELLVVLDREPGISAGGRL
jgi:hypothetical protein